MLTDSLSTSTLVFRVQFIFQKRDKKNNNNKVKDEFAVNFVFYRYH